MPSRWRTVRVFISSTFRDMHAERDHLVRVVFPALRERLLPHRIHLDDIDLRWGVTQEQADRDMALDLCLDQIDRARPFFIGILGERYGYVPRGFSDAAASRYGWIQHETGRSITELEILYGVLRKHEMRSRAMFFLRDPAFIADVPAAIRPQVKAEDAESAAKLARLKQAIREAGLPVPPVENYPCRFAGLRINWRVARFELPAADVQALEAVAGDGLITADEYEGLDARLREVAGRQAVVHLEGLEAFGRAVRDRLWEAIKAQYNLPDAPSALAEGERDELAEELDYHQRFMESRLRVYVGRETVHRELTAFADGDETVPCLVTGPSGSGKSAALARFATDYTERHPQTLVIPHFIGASPASTNLRQMLRRFCMVLAREFAFTDTREEEGRPPETVPAEVPQTINELVPKFRDFIGRVPEDRRVLFVIDALNQLDESDNAHALYWLPREWPEHVKAVVSSVSDPGRTEQVLDAFAHRPCRRVELAGLSGSERLEIVHQVPSLSAKTLDPRQVGLLLENPATENPLFLLVALEELRGFGSFEHLSTRIRALPREGDTVTAVFTQVIERLEDDFGEELTRTVLSLLASARRGLADRELLELIEGAGRAIEESTGDLFPVLRQIRPYLLHRGELNDFYHRNFLKAVREKYLASDEARAAAHARLVEYFRAQDYWMESLEEQRARARRLPPTPRPANVRKVDELPWQVLEVAKLLGRDDPQSPHWDAVADLLTDWHFLEAKTEAQP
jgi:telomerase protein component 1